MKIKKNIIILLAAILSLPISAQTVEKNKLNFTRISNDELGDVYSLGDTLFADANDFNKFPRVILYNKEAMEYRHKTLYVEKYPGEIQEQFAIFPEGKFSTWTSKNIIYPKKALKKRIHGVVSIACIIDTTGHATHITLENQPDELLVKEATRLLSVMPAWTPAHFNDRKGNMSCILDIWFELPANAKKK